MIELEVMKAIMDRRSIRSYIYKSISEEDAVKILNAGRWAPSGGNRQPWKFIIISDQALMKRLSDESKKNLLSEIEKDPSCPTKRFEETLKDSDFNVFYNAPCLIIIAGENNYSYFNSDCGLAVSYLMFAATAKKLGTCWIGLGSQIRDPKLREEIGLPENYEIVAPIILGYPKSIPEIVASFIFFLLSERLKRGININAFAISSKIAG